MKKAFTLVEMLIVIVIIGILAAALIPRLTGIQGRARDVARKGDIQQISTALSTYNLDNGTYVTGAAAGAWWDAATALNTALVTNGKLLKSLPKDPNNSSPAYQYATNTAATVFALGANNEWGGTNANWTGAAGSINAIPSFAAATSSAAFVPVTVTTTDGANGLARYVLAN